MKFIRFETTPNPNAIKCVIERTGTAAPGSHSESAPGSPPGRPVNLGIRSYFNEPAARDADDPLAHALFDIEGVANLLIHTDFITVGKAPGAKWSVIKPRIKTCLQAAGGTPHA